MRILYLHPANSLNLLLDSLGTLRALARIHVDFTILAPEPVYSLLSSDPLLPRVVQNIGDLAAESFDLAICGGVGRRAREQLQGIRSADVLFPLEGLGSHPTGDELGYAPDLLPARLREHGLLPVGAVLGAASLAVPSHLLHDLRGRLQDKRPAILLATASGVAEDLPASTRNGLAELVALTGAGLLEAALPPGLDSEDGSNRTWRRAPNQVSLLMLAALCSEADLVLTDARLVVRLAAACGGRGLQVEVGGENRTDSEALFDRAFPLLPRALRPGRYRGGRPAPGRRFFSARVLTEPERIAAFRLDNLGDVLMVGPALRTLKENFPRAALTLVASPAGSQLAPLLPWVDDVMTLRASWQQLALSSAGVDSGEEEYVARLFDRHFDAAFIFTSFSQSPHAAALSCRLAGIPVRVGESKEQGFSSLTHQRPPLPEEVHQVDRNLALLEFLGIRVRSRRMEVRIPAEARFAARRLLREGQIEPGEPFIVLNPWATAQARTYHPLRAARAASILKRETGWPVVLVGGGFGLPGGDEVAAEVGEGVLNLTGMTSVPELAAVLERGAIVLANDSLCMHLADALGVPSVITYSGTEYESQWRPRFSRSRLLRRPTACTPCYRFTCPYGLGCLDIQPERVAAEALELLSGRVTAHERGLRHGR